MNKTVYKTLKRWSKIGLFCFYILTVNYSVFGQNISFSQSIINSTDNEIVEVKELWNSYIQDCVKSFIIKDKTIVSKYWNEEEVENGFSNLVMYQISSKFPICLYGEVVTYDITKLDNSFFRIKTMILQSDSISKGVVAMFSIYVKKKNSGYKFYTHFSETKLKLNTFETDNFKYYYSSNFKFDKDKAVIAEKFRSKIIEEYKFQPTEKVIYLLGKNLDEANYLLGFDYSIRSSTSKNAGYYMPEQNLLLSCQIDHYHEIVHSIFESKFPNAAKLFHEGIATYYGGTSGEKIDFHISLLRELVEANPEIDLSEFNNWDKIVDNKTNPFYTIGAMFIARALEVGGTGKVHSLFKYANSDEDINSTLKNELSIEKQNIDSFLKDYLKNY